MNSEKMTNTTDPSENQEKGRSMYKKNYKSKNNNNKNNNKSRNDISGSSTDLSENAISYNMERVTVKTLPFHKILDYDADHSRCRDIMEKFCSKIQNYQQNAISCLFDSRYNYIYEALVPRYQSDDMDFDF
jgi:hypothetical protein